MSAENSYKSLGTVESNGVSEQLSKIFTEFLYKLATVKNVNHAVMAVEKGDQTLRWAGAIGDANPDGTPMKISTPFMIASITKLYIATAILKLSEIGKLDIWQPAEKFLPAGLIDRIHVFKGTDYTPKITIYNLLSHTSGLPDYIEEQPKDGATLVERISRDGDFSYTLEECIQTVRDFLEPHFPPQDPEKANNIARYSDTNYRLLIAIIEEQTSMDLQQAFEELIFKPLNLINTFLSGEKALKPAPKHSTLWFADQPIDIPMAIRSFGDLYSTIDDSFKFFRGLIDGSVFNDSKTSSLMQKKWNRFGSSIHPDRLRSPGWPIDYGMGMMRFQLPRLFTGSKTIPALIGHTGSTGTWLFYCPELDLYLTGAVDQVTAGAIPFRTLPTLLKKYVENS